jgi:prolyl oligopeptidase
MQMRIEPYPDSPIESRTEILHGIPVTDAYRWLEEQDSPRTRKWVQDQVSFARSHLDALPGRDRVKSRIREVLSTETIDKPRKIGNRVFFVKRVPHFEQPLITMREGLNGQDVTLLNPATYFPDTSHAVDLLSVSNNAKLLAFSVRTSGEDFQAIRVLDIDRREVLPDSLPRGFCRGFVFADDSSGFFYAHEPVDPPNSSRAAYWHRFHSDAIDDIEIFSAGADRNVRLALVGSSSSPYIGFVLTEIGAARTHDFLLVRKRGQDSPQLALTDIRGRFVPRLSRNFAVCFILSDQGNGEIIAANLEHTGGLVWHTVVPQSAGRIHDFAVASNTVFVGYVEDAESRIEIFDITGKPEGSLPTPPQGTSRLFPCNPDSDVLFYRFSSFVQPQNIYCYEVQTKSNRLWSTEQLPFDTPSLVVDKSCCLSADGTRIPVHLMRHKRSGGGRPLPTLLTAYGGFGHSVTPQFSILGTLLAEKSCLFAVACVRGGSEFGERWHQAAKGHNRQKAVDDFLAASEWLIQNGHTHPNRLAIAGGSNGALLAAAATMQRPDRFRVTLCLGPLLDMLRYHLFDDATNWIEEYGSADNAQDFPFLLAHSPYHQVKDNTSYPAVLFVSGDSDSRCNPMHARKMTARLQAATASQRPILLDYRSQFGHAPAQPLQTRIDLMTDRLSFLCSELGLDV